MTRATRSRARIVGKAGAELVLAKLQEWSRLAVTYLDGRDDKGKPITVTEVRRHLRRNPLRLNQAEDVVLAWLLSGHIAAAADGALYDARWLGYSEPTRQRTEDEATRRIGALLADPEVGKHLGPLLAKRLAALPRRLKEWTQYSAECKAPQRAVHRRGEAAAKRRKVSALVDAARARDQREDWANATGGEWAAAILLDLSAIQGKPLDPAKAVGLHTAACKRLVEARRAGLSPSQVRDLLARYWGGWVAHAAAIAADTGRAPRVPSTLVLAPLISPKNFQVVLGRAPNQGSGWVHDVASGVGT